MSTMHCAPAYSPPSSARAPVSMLTPRDVAGLAGALAAYRARVTLLFRRGGSDIGRDMT